MKSRNPIKIIITVNNAKRKNRVARTKIPDWAMIVQVHNNAGLRHPFLPAKDRRWRCPFLVGRSVGFSPRLIPLQDFDESEKNEKWKWKKNESHNEENKNKIKCGGRKNGKKKKIYESGPLQFSTIRRWWNFTIPTNATYGQFETDVEQRDTAVHKKSRVISSFWDDTVDQKRSRVNRQFSPKTY